MTNKSQQTVRLSLYGLISLVALVILADFLLPGNVITEEIISLQRARQQHYNASGNAHYSYKVVTREHAFSVERDFATPEMKGEQIEFSLSRIFTEVNWYRLLSSEEKSFHSLRMASGLVLPLLALLLIGWVYLSKRNMDIWVFVCLLLLIADLVYLMI